MHPLNPLVGRKVIFAAEDSFLSSYLLSGFRHLGVDVLGPVASADVLLEQARAMEGPSLACIDVNLPGLTPSHLDQLGGLAVQSVMFGVPSSGHALTNALLWPFSAFQMAQELASAVSAAAARKTP